MIYITGDTHGTHDIAKLMDADLAADDYLIICGDFGGIWYGDDRDNEVLDWYAARKYTVLFIDGNHENFDAIYKYPVEEWNGGMIHRIRPNLIHLMRGQVFTIEGRTFFTFGGGLSIDKIYRQEGISWWAQEIPSVDEVIRGSKNLDKYGWNVDVVLTHTAPTNICALLNPHKIDDPVCPILDNFEKHLEFKKWFFGHFHRDYPNIMGEPFVALYNEIVILEFKDEKTEV